MGYPDNNLEAQAWVATFHQGLQNWVEDPDGKAMRVAMECLRKKNETAG